MTLPPREKLTYDELIKILADQQLRIERIETQLGFHDYQVLKARLEMGTVNRKYPFKLKELEDSFKGFVAHHEKNPHIEKKVKTYEFDSVDGCAT